MFIIQILYVYDVCICILYIVMIIINNLYADYSNPQYDIYIYIYKLPVWLSG